MITLKEIEQNTMSPEKRKSAKNDYFAFYIGRPLSYALTIPFLYTGISPNAVSLISILPIVIGFVIMGVATDKAMMIVGWLFFFLWNLLDGVDGNIKQFRQLLEKIGGRHSFPPLPAGHGLPGNKQTVCQLLLGQPFILPQLDQYIPALHCFALLSS